MKFFIRTPILIVLARVAWAIQIIIAFILATYTNFVNNILSLNFQGHHILFFLCFSVLAFLSIFPQKSILIFSAINRNRGYVLFLFVFAILSLEIILRVVYPDKFPVYSKLIKNKHYVINGEESLSNQLWENDNYFSFKLKANLNIQIKDIKVPYEMSVKTNADGFRFFNQDKTRRNVMVLGDSVTFGIGVENSETYPDQLGKILGDEFNVLNFGVGGWGFAEYFLAFKKYFKDYSPELVIIGVFGGNDFEDLYNANWEGKESGDLPKPPLKRSDIFLDEDGIFWKRDSIYGIPLLKSVASAVFFEKSFVTPLRKFSKKIISNFVNRLSNEEISFKIISYIAEKSSNLLVIILPPEYHYPRANYLKRYVEKLKSLDGVKVLDFYPILKEKYKTIYVDGTHLNVEGNEIVAREIKNFIERPVQE